MKRVIALMMILALLLPALPAFAAETVYAGKMQVQVYAAKSTMAKKIGKLSYGESVTCTNYKEFSNGWAKIKNADGKVGYCKMNQLTDENPNTLNIKLETGKNTRMYAKPNTASKMLAKFGNNVSVKALAITPNCKWFRVKYLGNTGYIKASQLSCGSDAWYIGQNIVFVNGNGAEQAVISYGEKVSMLNPEDKRVLVMYDGKAGYCNCKASAFTDEDPNTLSKKAYAVADGVRFYKLAVAAKAHTNTALDRGAKVTVVAPGDDVDFVRVKYKDKYGYVLKNCLVDEKPETDVVMLAGEALKVYKGKLFTTDVLASVEAGEELTIIEVKHARAKVTTADGITGWVKLSLLKLK